MKPIQTPFTARQLSKLLDTMTPEQLDMPLWIYLVPDIRGNVRVLSMLSNDLVLSIHTDGFISEMVTNSSNISLINEYHNSGRN